MSASLDPRDSVVLMLRIEVENRDDREVATRLMERAIRECRERSLQAELNEPNHILFAAKDLPCQNRSR